MSDFIASSTPLDDPAQPPRGLYGGGAKRVFDLVLCLLLAPFILPVIVLLCLPSWRSGAPAIFGHRRVGRGGRPFLCWKIRTMVPDAERRLDHLLSTDAAAAAQWAWDQKLRNDPRVTPFGRILRQTSLDELPQILNVLKGEMSLVGPRPVTEAELARYGSRRAVYLALRPGLSGLWQVSGRDRVSYRQRVQMDEDYRRTLSFWADVRILLRTVSVLLSKPGS